jgi:serine/threonine-protein kinase
MNPAAGARAEAAFSWLGHEELFRAFEAAWHGNAVPSLAAFLPAGNAGERLALLHELIKIDLEYRWRSGRRTLTEDYVASFPELSDSGRVPVELIRDEVRIRAACGQAPAWEELARRFPDHGDDLRSVWSEGHKSGDGETNAAGPVAGDTSRGADQSAPPGRMLGRYELRQELGRGGFATVYRAWDPQLRREVAIKTPREPWREPAWRGRFLREAQAAARLRHPAIVPIHEVIDDHTGDDHIGACIVYEYIPGPTLAEVLRDTQPAPRQCAAWVVRLAEALDYAHQSGIVHRDVKPANVLMDRDGQPMLADFGLAKQIEGETVLTQEGDILGTPAYMSPEQARGDHALVDGRSDVYSLGVVLYQALCKQLPFQGSGVGILQKILHDDPPAPTTVQPSIPADLETICLKAMAREPERRYASAAAFADDLQRYLEHRPIAARRTGAVGRLVRWCRRKPTQAALTATVVLLLAGAAGAGLWQQRQRALHHADLRAGVERAYTEASTLAKEAERLRHRPAEWRAFMNSALQAMQRAESQLAEHEEISDEQLRTRVHRLRRELDGEEKDRRMLERLDGILFRLASIDQAGIGYATRERLPEYDAAFREYGIPAIEMPPARAAEWIRGRPQIVRDRLTDALYAWTGMAAASPEQEHLAWMRAVLAEVCPEAWQQHVLKAVLDKDRAALEKLCGEADLDGPSPRLLDLLAGALWQAGAKDQAVRFLERVHLHHGNDFWINHNLASLSAGLEPPQLEQAVRYFTVAAALRPEDAGALCNLGVNLHRVGRMDAAALCFERAIAVNPTLALSYTNLANVLWAKGDLDGAVEQCHKAIAVAPKLPVAHFSLGIALAKKRDLPGASSAYRRAIELQPDYADVHCNLGVALQLQGDLDGAIAAYRSALRHNPKFAMAHNNLGEALVEAGDPAAALVHYRRALAIQGDYAQAWCGLGLALKQQGEFIEALRAIEKGDDIGRKRGGWRHPSALWLAELQRLVALDARLAEVMSGREKVAAAERREFARLCQYKQFYAQATSFWQDAFSADPRQLNWPGSDRYDAACAAALAGCGRGKDEPPPSAAARAGCRQRAFEWLGAELAVIEKALATANAANEQNLRQKLRAWQKDHELDGIREPAEIGKLPLVEQPGWRRLWSEVASLIEKKRQP